MDSSYSFFASAGRCGDLARTHEVADILLQEFVVTVQFVVFLLDGLDAIEYH